MNPAEVATCPSVGHDDWCRYLVEGSPLMLSEESLRQIAVDASGRFNKADIIPDIAVRWVYSWRGIWKLGGQ